MQWFGRLLLLLLLVLLVALGAAGYVVLNLFSEQPSLAEAPLPPAAELVRLKSLLDRADPRALPAGTDATLRLEAADLQSGLDALLQTYRAGAARVEIADSRAVLRFSLRLPPSAPDRFLNGELVLVPAGDWLQMQSLRLGEVAVPGLLADRLPALARRLLLRRAPAWASALQAIQGLGLAGDSLTVVYHWQPTLMDQLAARSRELLLSPDNQARLIEHAQHLNALLADPGLPRVASLTRLLGPMFRFAESRGGDAVEENRAALLVLALYGGGLDVSRVLGTAASAPAAPVAHEFRLQRREDFARHLLVSAGLASSAGTALSDALGVLRELDDAQDGGSGFSFTDLGADRSGVRLAERATADQASARKVQQLLADPALQESVFMADFGDLPEFMPAAEFEARFGTVGSPAYLAILEDIEGRISRLPLFLP